MTIKNGFRSSLSLWLSSITGRLTVLYVFSAFGTLVLATGFLYWLFVNNLEKNDIEFLTDNIHVLRVILDEHQNDHSLLREEVQWEGPAHRSTKYYIRVLDEKGRPVVETPGINAAGIASFPFPPPVEAHETPVKGEMWTFRGTPYLLMSAFAESHMPLNERMLIQIALNVSHTRSAVAYYRRAVFIVLLCSMLFSAVVGVVVARRGMRPLQEITDAVRRVSVTQLHERIGSKKWASELTYLASAFDRMLVRLESSFEQLSRFSADMAHELRTPINNLMGEAEVTLSRARTTDEYRYVLESNVEEYRKLSRMIDNLLFLARAEDSRIVAAKIRFAASQEIEAVRQYYEVLAEEQGIEISCTGDAPVNADPALFQRAMNNLLSNAIKYTPAGGKIVIDISQSGSQAFTEIRINDTGMGIPQSDLPKIYDRFYRSDLVRQLNPEGTGLGLAIVKSIMDIHGGTVVVQSEPGKGTTAILRFPSESSSN